MVNRDSRDGSRNGSAVRAPWHLWLVGSVCLLIGLGMLIGYLGTVFQTPILLAYVPPGTMDLVAKLPSWALAARATGILAAPTAALLLLARSRHAFSAFIVLLCALIIGTLGEELVNLPEAMQTTRTLAVKGATWAFIVGAVVYAHWMRLRHVLR
ncbi:hypothetical protein EDF58_108128 [Novosphingobium sp. PhB57]|uniref:hypothetical protein n=1 Tax=Novosphingobium sp. PhB57 TaxID=2485107 RepID=UPI001045392F|nr:hypothetical protein [Novosphingobium sp. PhB57]TCU54697.1 hypothetical protein EDF58_108128 [Novosphingobium sp. PhB57]